MKRNKSWVIWVVALVVIALVVAGVWLWAHLHSPSDSKRVGEVSTEWKLLGENHKIKVDVFDDPKVKGVACFISQSQKGGVMGTLNLATESNDASIACRQTDEISFSAPIGANEEVFSDARSVLFKKQRVVRMYDKDHNTLVYLTYSDRLVNGSPQNSISVVPLFRVKPTLAN